jgi:hypothetical protein
VNREAVGNSVEGLSTGATKGLQYLYEEPSNNDDDDECYADLLWHMSK